MKYLLLAICVGFLSTRAAAESPFVFRDVTESAGLAPQVDGIRGHGAGWGDFDGDGSIDLYVATFGGGESKNNLLFRNRGGKFQLEEQSATAIPTRGTGVVLVDLDNDGDLDLYVGSMPQAKVGARGCALFRNDEGTFVDVSSDNGACPAAFGGRSVCALDYDGDGLLDLLVGEDPLSGYNGSPTKSTRLFRNLGGLAFEDASRAAGLPEGIPGLGVAAGDVNNDTWPDVFIASHNGGNRLLLNDRGKFREVESARKTFHWPEAGGDNMVCGVCFGDVNRDGWLDLVLGQHFDSPWRKPVPSRLYLHRGLKEGEPQYEDVTAAAGLVPLSMKAPHVEVQDYDNDGWPDISMSIVMFADGAPHPVIFKNSGSRGGLPQFRADSLRANDFPTDEDLQPKGSKAFFERVLAERKVIYSAPGPTADYDNDGRLDMFLPSWWAERRSLLLRNETPGNNWLQIVVQDAEGVNAQALGARINVYPAGKLGDAKSLLGAREMAVGFGYASGQPAIAHFGLGRQAEVDIEVILPHGRGQLERKKITANQRLTIKP